MDIKLLRDFGKIYSSEKANVVHKYLNVGEEVPAHSHPEHEVLLVMTQGEIEVKFDNNEEFVLKPGEMLSFDGNHMLSIHAQRESDFFVVLISK